MIAKLSIEEQCQELSDAGLLPGLDYKDLMVAEQMMYRVEEALGQQLLAQGTDLIGHLLPPQQLGSIVIAHQCKELWDMRTTELGLWRKKDWETLLLNGCIDKDDLRAISMHERWDTANEEEKEEFRRIMRTVKEDDNLDWEKDQQRQRAANAALMKLCQDA